MATLGEEHADTATLYLRLGSAHQGRQRVEDAAAAMYMGLRLRRRVLGDTHAHTAAAAMQLGQLLLDHPQPQSELVPASAVEAFALAVPAYEALHGECNR